MHRWVLASVVASALGVLGFRWLRDYPWLLASFGGLGVGALVFATFSTFHRLGAQRAQLRDRWK